MNDSVTTRRRRGQAGYSMVELLVVLVFISIIAGIAAQTALYAFDVARLGRSTANMRQAASALLQYQSMQSTLPGGGLQRLSAIVPLLGNQAGNVDPMDGWSHDLWYQPVTVNGSATFRIYCYGKDNTPDGAITGTWVDFNTDVVQEGGTFIQTKW